jgi:hypothetical protein
VNNSALEIVEAVAVLLWLSLPLVLILAETIRDNPNRRAREITRRRCAGVRFLNH